MLIHDILRIILLIINASVAIRIGFVELYVNSLKNF